MDNTTASRLVRAETCPASMALPAVHTPGGKYAVSGHGLHEELENIARGKREGASPWLLSLYDELTEGAIEVYAERCYAWDPATGKGRDLGTHGRDYSGLQPGEIGGTADLVVVRKDDAFIPDYKSGYFGAPRESVQLSLLALAVRDAHQRETISVAIAKINADDKTTEVLPPLTYDALDLEVEAARVRGILRRVDDARELVKLGKTPDVRLSDNGCRYCPCHLSCPGKVGAIAVGVSLAGLTAPGVTLPVTPENAGKVWMFLDAIDGITRAAREEVKELAKKGPIPLPDGRELWCEEKSRDAIADVDKLVAALTPLFGAEAANAVVVVERSATKGAVEELAKKVAPPRTGTKAAKALVEKLVEEGAIKRRPHLSYSVKEKKAG